MCTCYKDYTILYHTISYHTVYMLYYKDYAIVKYRILYMPSRKTRRLSPCRRGFRRRRCRRPFAPCRAQSVCRSTWFELCSRPWGFELRHAKISWPCLSNATCIIRPHVFYAIVSRIAIICKIVHHF